MIEDITGVSIDADFRQVARLHALTHDVTHIVAGHTIEDQLAIFPRHDENLGRFKRLLDGENSELKRRLSESDIGRLALDRLIPEYPHDDLVNQMISGVIGADVLDYIDRDAINCGLDHRVDTAIFRQLRLYDRDSPTASKLVSSNIGKYGIRVDREYAVERLLSERYAMFLKVYCHSTKLAVGG